jgi:hypothetical protein
MDCSTSHHTSHQCFSSALFNANNPFLMCFFCDSSSTDFKICFPCSPGLPVCFPWSSRVLPCSSHVLPLVFPCASLGPQTAPDCPSPHPALHPSPHPSLHLSMPFMPFTSAHPLYLSMPFTSVTPAFQPPFLVSLPTRHQRSHCFWKTIEWNKIGANKKRILARLCELLCRKTKQYGHGECKLRRALLFGALREQGII